MNQIDINLMEAWERVGDLCRRDRVEALRRYRRSRRAIVQRPVRSTCLAIRAADTRINPFTAAIEFEPETELVAGMSTEQAVKRGYEHIVTIEGRLIRELTKPVTIPWPGIARSKAAKRLGLSDKSLDNWIECGALRISSFANARSLGSRGKPVPIVFTPSPLDPNQPCGSAPDPIWGTLWQWRHEKIPENYILEAKRVPRWKLWQGRIKVVGWDWICPGRATAFTAEDAERAEKTPTLTPALSLRLREKEEGAICGRRVRYLYGPVPTWTIGAALDDALRLDLPEECGLFGGWHPGQEDPRAGMRSFACKSCWHLQNFTLTTPGGWNLFVAHLSGGLLYGHEVKRPWHEAPMRRKRAVRTHVNSRWPERRAELIEGLMSGWERSEIARRLGISVRCLDGRTKRLYGEEGVHNRAELALRLGRTVTKRTKALPRHVLERRENVFRLRVRGLSLSRIAAEVGINIKTVCADLRRSRRSHRPATGATAPVRVRDCG